MKTDLVYFLLDALTNTVKIGHSTDVAGRLKQLQTGRCHKLALLGVIPGGEVQEKKLHARFDTERLSGEWFRGSPKLMQSVEQLIESKGVPTTAKGEAVTISDELKRRNNCREGLGGVVVVLRDEPDAHFRVAGSMWTANRSLRVKLASADDPEDVVHDVPASECFLLSRWPITCRCWCPERELQEAW